MANLSLLSAIEFARSHGQLASRTVSVHSLMQQYQPVPAGSVRALITKMYASAEGIDYLIVPIFWGPTHPLYPGRDAVPFTPQEFVDQLNAVEASGYFALLSQYGAQRFSIFPPIIFNDPWPAGDGNYNAIFTENDITSFLVRHMPALPQAGGNPRPIYQVMIPDGSLLSSEDMGAHNTFSYQDNNIIWYWLYATHDISGAMLTATHEIAECVGRDFGVAKELCDFCGDPERYPDGFKAVNGLNVATYMDAFTGRCVAPGAIKP